MATIYARLINRYKFINQAVFSTRFDKQDEDNQLLDETELYIHLKIKNKFKETDINNFNIKSPIEHQIQRQEVKDSGWRFEKIISMIIYFYKTTEMNGSNYVKIPFTSSAILNIEDDDNYCSIWSILAISTSKK